MNRLQVPLFKDHKSTMFWTELPKKEVFESLFHYFEPKAKQMKYTRGKPNPAHIRKLQAEAW